MRAFNLFVSHSWSYSDAYDKLVRLLRERTYFNFKDYSVPRNDPIHNAPTDPRLRAAIYSRMSPCSVVLILAGVYATHSSWINKEIDLAKNSFREPKPILAIEPWGSERTSTLVKNAANRVVKWNSGSIVNAIRELTR